VIIGQSHGGTRNGLVPDSFFCGGQGHDYDEQARAICIGHRTMHQMFNDPPEFTDPEGGDIPLGTRGEKYLATTVFDGWGYVQLHDARDPNLRIIDSYAVPEALDEQFAGGHGVLSVHEVESDPRRNVNLAYISYYDAGARAVEFSNRRGIVEKASSSTRAAATSGARSRTTSATARERRCCLLFSDCDFGLYILRYDDDRRGDGDGDDDDDRRGGRDDND
jgi:hypothetical protein